MATEKEANLARDQHSEILRKLGAHAIGVDEVRHRGERTFAVIAFFEKKPECVPGNLVLTKGTKTLHVPLIARVKERFKTEEGIDEQ